MRHRMRGGSGLPIYNVGVDFGCGEVRVMDSCWLIGTGVDVWELW
jgi:hypothetical protein